jgi:hypothetical protein
MLSSFSDSLCRLKSDSVHVSDFAAYTDAGMAGVRLIFAPSTTLQANYWRVVNDGNKTRR